MALDVCYEFVPLLKHLVVDLQDWLLGLSRLQSCDSRCRLDVRACRVFVVISVGPLLASWPQVLRTVAVVAFACDVSLRVVAASDLFSALVCLLVHLRIPVLYGLRVGISRDASV